MRWFVEITSLTAGAAASRLTVEAATWQGALAQARNVQKDTAPLSNFTIEVLPDGYRATNGLARTRYVVSKAPEDAPLYSGERTPSTPPPDSSSPASVAANVLGRRSTGRPPAAAPRAPEPAVSMPAAIVERGKIILRKAEDPGHRSPLSYRELAVAVVAGTPVPHALSIARANLGDLQGELASAPAGKLVQLAVFDHEWSGRPQRPPLVALTWKDWRGAEPEVKYPSGGAPTASPAVNRQPTPQPRIDPTNIASEISSAVAAARAPMASPSRPEIPAAIESFVSSGLIQAAPAASPPQPRPVAMTQPYPQSAPQPAPQPAPPQAPPQAGPVHPRPVAMTQPYPDAGLPSVPSPAPMSFPMGAPRPSRPDDLVSELFESMHDVHFMRDALDAADFVLELLREKIPTIVAMVHFYDINAKEFVVVKARAPQPDVASRRTAEGQGLISAALKSAKPIFIPDASQDARWQRDRYAQAGHPSPQQIVIVPMRQGGRFLGGIELADHSDGQTFGDNEIHALSYVAEQFGEFLAERGIQLVAADTGSFQVIDPTKVAPRAR